MTIVYSDTSWARVRLRVSLRIRVRVSFMVRVRVSNVIPIAQYYRHNLGPDFGVLPK